MHTFSQFGQYPNSLGNEKKTKKIRIGGADTYSLRGATLVEGYFPGAMRPNFLADPIYRTGQIDFGTFGNDQNFNGPGSLLQAVPDGSRYQNKQIFESPRPTINKEVGLDDRQLASYQVEQLHNNPLSQYTTNPDAPIPGFDCNAQPNNFSTMVNKRQSQVEELFKDIKPNNWQNQTGATQVPGRAAGAAENVYQQYTGAEENPNTNVVYNMSLNSKEQYNPFISQGSVGVNESTSQAEFSGLCYSGQFVPGQKIKTNSGPGNAIIYGPNRGEPITVSDIGFMNQGAYNSTQICQVNRAADFANPLILNPIH